jgi:hypothetical protein
VLYLKTKFFRFVLKQEQGKKRGVKPLPYDFTFFSSGPRFPLMESGFSLIFLKTESPLANLLALLDRYAFALPIFSALHRFSV